MGTFYNNFIGTYHYLGYFLIYMETFCNYGNEMCILRQYFMLWELFINNMGTKYIYGNIFQIKDPINNLWEQKC